MAKNVTNGVKKVAGHVPEVVPCVLSHISKKLIRAELFMVLPYSVQLLNVIEIISIVFQIFPELF